MSDGCISAKQINNHQNQEEPERGFRGTFAPKVLHDLVEKGKLPAMAAWLAMVIDSLSKSEMGCFASNEYLASKIHRSANTVNQLLAKMERRKILTSCFIGKKRYLKLVWERKGGIKRRDAYLAESRVPKNGEFDQSPQKWGVRVPKNGELESPKMGTLKAPKNDVSSKRGVAKGVLCDDLVFNTSKEEERGAATPLSPPSKNGFSTNGHHHSDSFKKTSPQGKTFAEDLSKILNSKKKRLPLPLNTNYNASGRHFDKLVKRLDGDANRVRKLLDWYGKNINVVTKPTVVSAKEFCSPVVYVWLEQEMEKQRNAYTDESGKVRYVPQQDPSRVV